MAAKLRKHDDNSRGGGCGVHSLPEDIILEVLVRLPVKALCRFRCVSQAWRALISDPAFVAAQKSRTGPLIVGVFRSRLEWHELRLLDRDGNVLRVFEVRGTALLAPTRLDLIFVNNRMPQLGAMIIDPASGRDFTIVGTNDPSPPWWVNWPAPASFSDYSFGRAVPSGDFKVLRLNLTSSSWYGDSLSCEVATFTDGGEELRWRPRPSSPFRTSFSCKHKATVDGVLYLKAHDTYSTSPRRNRIAAFDLESEEWKTETIKGRLWLKEEKGHIIVLTELKGTLCMHGSQRMPSPRFG